MHVCIWVLIIINKLTMIYHMNVAKNVYSNIDLALHFKHQPSLRDTDMGLGHNQPLRPVFFYNHFGLNMLQSHLS